MTKNQTSMRPNIRPKIIFAAICNGIIWSNGFMSWFGNVMYLSATCTLVKNSSKYFEIFQNTTITYAKIQTLKHVEIKCLKANRIESETLSSEPIWSCWSSVQVNCVLFLFQYHIYNVFWQISKFLENSVAFLKGFAFLRLLITTFCKN